MTLPTALSNVSRCGFFVWLGLALAACGLSQDAATVSAPDAPAAADNRWSTTTDAGLYVVALAPRDGKPVIGAFHEWVIEVRDKTGTGVHPAQLSFDGGMPDHGHGLPTAPRVSDHLGAGRYRLEGVRFNMAGAWTLIVGVDAAQGRDRAQFEIELGF